MSVTVTGKLNKAANQFQAGESIGFSIRIGVKYYDRETKQNEWTNYEAVIFAKNPNQISFYQQSLVEGAIVEITGANQKIKQFQGNNGLSLSIEILEAKLGVVYSPDQPQQAPQQGGGFNQPAGGFGAPQQPAPQAPNNGFSQPAPQGLDDFDDDVQF